jgi:hypothetical protein
MKYFMSELCYLCILLTSFNIEIFYKSVNKEKPRNFISRKLKFSQYRTIRRGSAMQLIKCKSLVLSMIVMNQVPKVIGSVVLKIWIAM